MTTARQRIMAYIRQKGPIGSAAIAKTLNMSPAAVRHHLGLLASDGRIVADGSLRKGERGRPVKLYRLSDHMLGDNLATLSDVLLPLWLTRPSPLDAQSGVEAVADGLKQKLGAID